MTDAEVIRLDVRTPADAYAAAHALALAHALESSPPCIPLPTGWPWQGACAGSLSDVDANQIDGEGDLDAQKTP